MSRAKLSRNVGVALSWVWMGGGHAYLGLWRRWFAFLGATCALMLIGAAIAPSLGTTAVLAGVGLLALMPVITTIDLLRLPEERFASDSVGQGLGRVVASGIVTMVACIAVSLTMRVFLLEAFKIPAGSMIPTLLVGDHVFVDKKYKRAKAGDVIVFLYPENREQTFVKRAIAFEHDSVSVDAEGLPTVNGVPAKRCRLGSAPLTGFPHDLTLFLERLGGATYLVATEPGAMTGAFGPYVVPSHSVFVLGDNRNNSHDSRGWRQGLGASVPVDDILGEPFSIWISFDETGRTDWARTGPIGDQPRLPEAAKALVPELARCLGELR